MSADDRPGGLGEVDDMGFPVLGTLARDSPGSGFRVDFAGACFDDVLTTLTGEGQKLDDSTIGHAILRAATMMAASSSSARTRSRHTSW